MHPHGETLLVGGGRVLLRYLGCPRICDPPTQPPDCWVTGMRPQSGLRPFRNCGGSSCPASCPLSTPAESPVEWLGGYSLLWCQFSDVLPLADAAVCLTSHDSVGCILSLEEANLCGIWVLPFCVQHFQVSMYSMLG